MASLRVKAQSLNITVDFVNKRLIGTTSVSLSLLFPFQYIAFLETTPSDSLPASSGLIIPIRCPSPHECSITSLDVGGVPASFVHRPNNPLKTNSVASPKSSFYDLLSYNVFFRETEWEQFHCENMCIDIPPLALHRASTKAQRSKQDPIVQQSFAVDANDAPPSSLKVTLPLKINIGFSLIRPCPVTSIAYFASYDVRVPGMAKVVHYNVFMTHPHNGHTRVWFPTVPGCWRKPNSDQKKASLGRCSWTIQCTVPLGMTAVSTGVLSRRAQETSVLLGNIPAETFYYETRGPLSAVPPEEICLFVGHFTMYRKPALCESFFSCERLRRCCASGVTLFFTFVPRILLCAGSPKQELQGDNTQTHPAEQQPNHIIEPEILCVSLKGVNKKFFKSVSETVFFALKGLHKAYGIQYPHVQILILFFPIGESSLRLGEAVLQASTSCWNDTIPHPGLFQSAWVFGTTIVVDVELLHHRSENHALVFRAKEVIAEGVLSTLFGSVWSVCPNDMAKDWWLLAAFRGYALDMFTQESLGIPHLSALTCLKLELYARLVETGYDLTTLSNAHLEEGSLDSHTAYENINHGSSEPSCTSSYFASSSGFNPYDILISLKARFILPSVQILLSASSTNGSPPSTVNEFDPVCSRWSPPSGTFRSFLCSVVSRAVRKGPGTLITTRGFLERLKRRLKAAFITSGAWQRAVSHICTEFSSAAAPHTSSLVPPTVETLDLSLYESIPSLNIGHLFAVVEGFFDSWVYGVGCSSASISFFIQLQKKTSTIAIESCRLRFDETPLQPPSFIDPYTGVSDFHPSILACQSLLESFLEESCELDNQQDARDHNKTLRRNTLEGSNHRQFFANHDLVSLLHECNLKLQPTVSPFELIVKDHGTGLGFGYTGRDLSPITDGVGNFYSFLEGRLNSDWSMVEPERRALLTADITARNALLCTQTDVRTLPLSVPPQYPLWFIPVAAAAIIRDTLRYSTSSTSCASDPAELLQQCIVVDEKAKSNTLNHESSTRMPSISTPLSFGFGKFYTDVLIVHVYGDHGVFQDSCFLCTDELPAAFDLRAFEDVGIFGRLSKPSQSHLIRDKSQSCIGTLHTQPSIDKKSGSVKFRGILSNADEMLLTPDSALQNSLSMMLSNGPGVPRKPPTLKEGLVTNRFVRKERTKHLSILWMRVMGATRPIWLARYMRCQSIGMWEHQFMNDPLTTAQLEAAEALGRIPFSPTVVSCLAWALRNHSFHPLVRSYAAQSLKRLHNKFRDYHASPCLSALLNYLYTYHYRSKRTQPRKEKVDSKAKNTPSSTTGTVEQHYSTEDHGVVPQDDPALHSEVAEKVPHLPINQKGVFELFPRNAPFWLTTEIHFLKDLVLAIAQLRGPDGSTTYEAVDTLTQLLMHHATDIPIMEQENADHYIAYIISVLKYIRFPFQRCGAAIEDVALPSLCNFLISLGGQQAQILEHEQQTWSRWKDDEMDSYAESLFLHVWRYFRLDYCLHSHHHILTCSCLEVFSRNPMLRDLLRLKWCEETKRDLQLLSYLPLNFLPILTQALQWVCPELYTSKVSLDFPSNVSGSVLTRHELEMAALLESQWDDKPLCKLMLTGLVEMIASMRDHYCHYQDAHVERAALKALLYCTAMGNMEPPLILITRKCSTALCDIQSVDSLCKVLQTTCFTQLPSSSLYAKAMQLVADKWSLMSTASHDSNSKTRTMDKVGDTSALSDIEKLTRVSRLLFCARWTSTEESNALQRSGVSLLNAVLLACRFDEILTSVDVVSLLGSVWDIFAEILEDLMEDAPSVFSAYCVKACRGLDEDYNGYHDSASLWSDRLFPDFSHRFPSCTVPSDPCSTHTEQRQCDSVSDCSFPTNTPMEVSDAPETATISASPLNTAVAGPLNIESPSTDKTSTVTGAVAEWETEWMFPPHTTADSIEHPHFDSDGKSSDLDIMPVTREEASSPCYFNDAMNLGKSPPPLTEMDHVDIQDLKENSVSIDNANMETEELENLNFCDSLFMESSSLVYPETSLEFSSQDFHVDNIFDDFQRPNDASPLDRSPLKENNADQPPFHSMTTVFSDQQQASPPNLSQIICAKAMNEYMHYRVLRYPGITSRRLTGIKKVYHFLFGVGLPQCLALLHDNFQAPDPFLVDTFNASLKHGRYLKKLCLFQKRYLEDDSPEVPDWQTLAMEIIELLMSLPLAYPFLDEVDADEAPNYRLVVNEPMWLRLIQEKLQHQLYGSYQDWKNDLFLIFRNCRTFNSPDSKIVQDCETLQTVVYSLLKPTEKLLSRSRPTNAAVS